MSDLIHRRMLVVVDTCERPNLHSVTYANSYVSISCYYEPVEGYVDFRFGPASIMFPSGIPKWPDSEKMISLRMLLKSEGIAIPDLRGQLYSDERLEEATVTLVQGIKDHEEAVFGSLI